MYQSRFSVEWKPRLKKKSFNLSRHGTLPTSDIKDLFKHAEKSKQKKSWKVNEMINLTEHQSNIISFE